MAVDNPTQLTDSADISTDSDLLDIEAAAALLHLGVRQFRKLVAQKRICPNRVRDRKHLYLRDDVLSLQGRRESSGVGASLFAAQAEVKALTATVARLKADIDLLQTMLGVQTPGLRHSDEDCAELYRRVLLMHRQAIWNSDAVRSWVDIFLAMDEHDILQMNRVTGKVVWPDLLKLVQRFIALAYRTRATRQDVEAYRLHLLLQEGHRRMRTSIYIVNAWYPPPSAGPSSRGVATDLDSAIVQALKLPLPQVGGRLPQTG